MDVGLFVDALTPTLTGIGRYCWELVRGVPHDSRVSRATYFLGSNRIADPVQLLRAGRVISRFDRANEWLRSKMAFNALPDVLHSPNYFLPYWAERGIVTVHDLSVFRYPETHPAERIASFEAQFRTTLNKAEHLIVDCETIRREVIDFTGFEADRVTAIPLGVSPTFSPISTEERGPILRSYGLPTRGYGLTLAALEPRKRINRLIAAWRILPDALRKQFPLVVAGAAGWKNDELRQELDRAAAEGWLISLGFVPEASLPSVYAGASLFAFPSLYEGFGLPPLEAMATGVPTIVASQSCLPEVTRGAAMEVDPDDVEGFSLSIQRALEDDQWRRGAISGGIEVARNYSWEKCVKNTVDLYERCANQALP